MTASDPTPGEGQLTHFDATGQAHMVLERQIAKRLGTSGETFQHRASLEHARRFCEAAGLSVLLEKYTQLLSQDQHDPFPSYAWSPQPDLEEDMVIMSKALAQVNVDEDDQGSECGWILVD